MMPLIGITSAYENGNPGRYFLREAYVKAVEAAGGLPVALTYVKEQSITKLVEQMDGFLFSGGSDVDPLYFGEEPIPGNGEIFPERDVFELQLAREVLKTGKPILAICRGIQVINIAAGGTIYQDIATQVPNPLKHCQEAPNWYPTHAMTINSGTRLAEIFGVNEVRVNSMHHQAIAGIAPGFMVSAISQDGVIEGIEAINDKFVVGLQCHPEYLWKRDTAFFNLFKTFLKAVK